MFTWQGFGTGGAPGMASVRRHQHLPPSWTEPVPAGSEMYLLLAQAEPISDSGVTPIAMGGSSCIHFEIHNIFQARGLKIKADIVEVFPRTSDSPLLLFVFKKNAVEYLLWITDADIACFVLRCQLFLMF